MRGNTTLMGNEKPLTMIIKYILIMKRLLFCFVLLMTSVQCRKESDDCHFFVTIQNNSDNDVVFSTGSDLSFSGNENSNCFINAFDVKNISSGQETKYRPYRHPDCIERRVKSESRLISMYLINPDNFMPGSIPCEEFEERNTILRTYILTLEDLERMDYTINYPEDASIGVD